MSKEKILNFLLENMDEENKKLYKNEKYLTVNGEFWTPADLFIRQYLNNGSDGFGMVNVDAVYKFLTSHKKKLIEHNMVSECGRNNSGFELWQNFDF